MSHLQPIELQSTHLKEGKEELDASTHFVIEFFFFFNLMEGRVERRL